MFGGQPDALEHVRDYLEGLRALQPLVNEEGLCENRADLLAGIE